MERIFFGTGYSSLITLCNNELDFFCEPGFSFSWHPGCVAQRVLKRLWHQKAKPDKGDCHSPPPTHNTFSGLRNDDLISRVPSEEECDARNGDSSNAAGYKKTKNQKLKIDMNFLLEHQNNLHPK